MSKPKSSSGAAWTVGVAAAGQAPGGHHPAAQWNLLEIAGKPGQWSARLTRRTLTGAVTRPIESTTIDLIGQARTAEIA